VKKKKNSHVEFVAEVVFYFTQLVEKENCSARKRKKKGKNTGGDSRLWTPEQQSHTHGEERRAMEVPKKLESKQVFKKRGGKFFRRDLPSQGDWR